MEDAKQKIEYFKNKLEEEKNKLEEGLAIVGKKNERVPGDWEVTAPDLNVDSSDPNDLADVFNAFQDRAAMEDKLEGRLAEVNQALNKIKKGTYGICQTCKKPIEEKRLEANPAAKNCIKHATNQ